jgi:hypothetical protein
VAVGGKLGSIRRVNLSFVGQIRQLDEKVSFGVGNISSLFQQRKRSNPEQPKESKIEKPDPTSLKTET